MNCDARQRKNAEAETPCHHDAVAFIVRTLGADHQLNTMRQLCECNETVTARINHVQSSLNRLSNVTIDRCGCSIDIKSVSRCHMRCHPNLV